LDKSEQKWYHDRRLLGILLLAGVLGLIYNGVILTGYGPDEPRHLAYVKLLFNEHRLPFLLPDGTEYAGAHTLHPPLYYLILLPFYAVLHGLPDALQWHALRAVSLALCLAALPLVYQIALRAVHRLRSSHETDARFFSDEAVACLAVAQIALLPMFGMTGGTINNDSATWLAVVVFLWLLAVKYPHARSLRSAAVLGVCLGLAALCKANALLACVAALVVYLLLQDGWSALRKGRSWMRLGIALGIGLSLAAPWFFYNWRLYGTPLPLPPPMPNPTGGDMMMIFHPDFPAYVAKANWGIFYSLWSQKDWLPEAVRTPIYLALALYVLCALGGFVARRRPSADSTLPSRIALWSAAGAFVVMWLSVLQGALFRTWGWAEGGRYLLPSLVGFSLPLALGWERWLGARALHRVLIGWIVALIFVNAVAIYWLLAYLNPTFGPKG
jgi:4-amino-4-deoxy-L-arabinose transferase-like glycosyltransferase